MLVLALRQHVLANSLKFCGGGCDRISTLKTSRWDLTSFYLSQHSRKASICHTLAKEQDKSHFHFCGQLILMKGTVGRAGYTGGTRTQWDKCSLYRRQRKPYSLRARPRFHLIQNHWSCICVSIIQQERCNPLWEGSRCWTPHYLCDRGIAGWEYIPPERLFWDQEPAVPLMTPSISRGPPATQIKWFLQFIHICVCNFRSAMSTMIYVVGPVAGEYSTTIMLHNPTVVLGVHALQWIDIILLNHTSHLSL